MASKSAAEQQGLVHAVSQGVPERAEPCESHCLVMTYNIGAPNDTDYHSRHSKRHFTEKLQTEILQMTQQCHVICLQEIAWTWSLILAEHLPPGWTQRWSPETVAILFKQSDWASWHAEHNICMFPNAQDDNNSYRHWRNFLEVSQVVGTIACCRLFVFCFILSLYIYIVWFFFLCLVCFADLHIFVCVFSLCTH